MVCVYGYYNMDCGELSLSLPYMQYKQAHDKSGIEESLHVYITRAGLTACEVGRSSREIFAHHLFKEVLKLMPWGYFERLQ